MESVYQGPVDQETAEAEQAALTPQDQLRFQWRQQTGFLPFIRQKNVIDQNAGLVAQAAIVALPGWTSPRMFALQGLVLAAVILSLANWGITRHAGRLEEQIVGLQAHVQTETKRQEEIIAATEAEIRRISNSGKAMFKLHLAATPLTREQALQALNNSLEGVGPLFWVVFWAGFYLLLLRYFAAVARGLYQALELKPGSSEWSLENTMLMRVHNSVVITFAAMEAVFLLLCYALYAAQRH